MTTEIILKFKEPIKLKIKLRAINIPASPILLNNKALKADLLVETRVCQNPINKKEQIPTPSHPTNKINRLSPKTNKNIKKLNREI